MRVDAPSHEPKGIRACQNALPSVGRAFEMDSDLETALKAWNEGRWNV
jgi:hypothetical protein